MSASVYLLTVFMFLATVLLVFGMRYFSVARQTKSRIATEDAYRGLAQDATSAQSQTAMSLSSVQMGLTEIAARLAAVEKLLKEVG